MVANGDRNLEALWKAHLMLKDRLSDVIEDLRRTAHDVRHEVQTICTGKGTSLKRKDKNSNRNVGNKNCRMRHEPRIKHNNRAISFSNENLVKHALSNLSESD